MSYLRYIALTLVLHASSSFAAPRHVYLTWQGDTASTITVNFQTFADTRSPAVYYSETPGVDRTTARRATGSSHQIAGLPDGRWIHWVELTNLDPNVVYHAVAGDEQTGFSEEFRFRTVPHDTDKLRFVVAGDMGTGPLSVQLQQRAANLSPQFAILGGDLAYANGALENAGMWDAWLDNWRATMVTPEGLLIPMVLAIGNHEVRGGYDMSSHEAPFFFGFFAQNGNVAYYSRTFGKQTALVVLDSGHTNPFEGAQKAWLEHELRRLRDATFKFSVYHVPLYPSHRSYDNPGSRLGRLHWAPLFDEFGLTAAFEHHDHSYKRTFLLRNHKKVEQNGTLYLGDGCFGIGSRATLYARPPYLAKSAGIEHFWFVQIEHERAEYRAVDCNGRVFDVYPESADGAREADEYFAKLPKKLSYPQFITSPGALLTNEEVSSKSVVTSPITIRNPLPKTVECRVDFPEQTGTRVEPSRLEVRLSPGETVETQVRLHGNFDSVRKCPASFKFTGSVIEADAIQPFPPISSQISVDVLRYGRRTTQFVRIDGSLEEWEYAEWHVSKPDPFRFAVSCDEHNLYIAAQVTDPLAGMLGIKKEPSTRREGLEFHLAFQGFIKAREPIRLFVPPGQKGQELPSTGVTSRIRFASEKTTAGYDAEIAIPKELISRQSPCRVRINIVAAVVDPSKPSGAVKRKSWRPVWGAAEDFTSSGWFHFE